jgi:hypothetical protein
MMVAWIYVVDRDTVPDTSFVTRTALNDVGGVTIIWEGYVYMESELAPFDNLTSASIIALH